jgi:hypothetical protein
MKKRTCRGKKSIPESLVHRRMQVALSLLLVLAALYLILFREDAGDTQKWAFGTIGTILGFWFRR